MRKADTLSFSEAAKRELASADKSFKQMSQDVQREVNKAQAQTQANNGCGKESCPCKVTLLISLFFKFFSHLFHFHSKLKNNISIIIG